MEGTMMTPADFHAMTEGNGDGFGSAWWIIILFLFMMGGNGFGFNRGNDATSQEILYNQHFNNLDNKIDRLGNGIADATFSLNNSINGEGRALQMQLADCCCNNRLAIANLTAQTDNQTASIIQAIHADGEQTRGLIQQNEMQTLRDKVASLEMDNRMCGVVRYPMTYAYSAGNSPFCNYNNGCGCVNNI